jgi:hypothetical protein
MRRTVRLFALLGMIALLPLVSAPPAHAQSSLPPHAWLFGSWIGGLFPPPSVLSAQECLAQPVVIFTRDLIMRATIIDQVYTQRLVETARVTGNGVEFRLSHPPQITQTPFTLSGGNDADIGFGCESPDVLHVQRRGENEISFPSCPEFPYPLVRCPAR